MDTLISRLDSSNVTVRRTFRRPPSVKYTLAPLDSATQVPWAAAIRAQYKSLAESSSEGGIAVGLLSTGLARQTVQSYDSKLNKFFSFCAGLGLCAMPAVLYTVLRYIAHLASSGTISVENVQPYLSCINTAHVAVGLNPPALGPAVEQARKGWRQRQISVAGTEKDKRLPLPAHAVRGMVRRASALVAQGTYKHDAAALGELRDVVAPIVTYLYFGRSDTGHAAEVLDDFADLQVHGTDLMFYERRFKGTAAGADKRTRTFPLSTRPEILQIVSAFLAVAPATSGYLWRLPKDARKWNATVIDDMLQRVLLLVGVTPPAGYVYTSHSLRSGAASGAFSIGVDILRICDCGGWAQGSSAVYSYIDLSWAPSPDAIYFFGHLRHNAGPLIVGNHP
jgi:hypothetical protein